MEYTNNDAINEVLLLTQRYDTTDGLVIFIRSEIEESNLERKFTDEEWDKLSREVFHAAYLMITDYVSELRDLDEIRQDDADLLDELKENKK